ncbi:C2 calcium/lipid-binding plant phosphoribosyltransferase familyprotein [Zostera marina]|uniref:C2 calcium/lipid-binding plant phosphoribosyltransferase familyprotein n=1 Tax=Zostera marina TaxID=29655 RepID=A0A0K9NND9_ZOSMR|nr:C2 calcium/lipid-binding plant phosphoribosyltransferase familyprotein [Zostera marina]
MKLAVEVLDASDLMPKDGQGSASPFVEVEFQEQRQRTVTRPRELNPMWNEILVFNVPDPSALSDVTVDVSVYNDRGPGQHRNFLGRVRVSASTAAAQASQAIARRCPLDKRGMFSNIRGEIGLKLYIFKDAAAQEDLKPPEVSQPQSQPVEKQPQSEQVPLTTSPSSPSAVSPASPLAAEEVMEVKVKRKKKEHIRHEFHSIGSESPRRERTPPPQEPVVVVRSDYARSEPPPPSAVVHRMQGPKVPSQNPEFALVETRPPLAGRLGYRGDKITSTYDLVEQMHFLYVNLVKAKDLPAMDITGSLDPYVEVKLGNYKGVTKHLDKNQNPVWRQIFAFSKERVQANVLEVVVKDKDILKDDFVGRVFFDLTEVPLRVPPDSPLAPQWYRLEDKIGMKGKGEIMLGVWMGTQADEAFPDAWHSDAHSIKSESLTHTRSKVYFSPKLFYLRVHVIEAQDLVPSNHSRLPETRVRIQLGNQMRMSRHSPAHTLNPVWNDELVFVASEPFDEVLVITVDDRVAPGKDEPLGRVVLPLRAAQMRYDHSKLVDPRWFNLDRPGSGSAEEDDKKKEVKFSSKIHLRLCLDAGYHVLDETIHYSSDLRPSAKYLRKPSIGVLEVGILGAKNLVPMKAKIGRTTDPYCVAKYGSKWVRTRTLLETLNPRWNEQYTWEVFDPCTVFTIGVFDNSHVDGVREENTRDQRIGKVRIRLSTLEANRIYTHFYPLLVLQPSGLKKTGELHLAVRFTCTAWLNMITLYSKPLLPKMHYIQPISVIHLDYLRHQAMQIVAARLSRSEPPLRRESIEYMLDVDSHMFSLRRSKANFFRIQSLLSGVISIVKWLDAICTWRNPVTTILFHVLFVILVCYPELILPTIFLYMFMIGLWNYRFRSRHPPHMDTRLSQAESTFPDELDEEFDTFPSSRPDNVVRQRYDRLRSVAGRVQTVVGDLATQGERAHALLSWRDSRATSIFVMLSLLLAVVLYVTPFQVLTVIAGLYFLRHPKFRTKMPSVPFNFYRRLPAKSDMLI